MTDTVVGQVARAPYRSTFVLRGHVFSNAWWCLRQPAAVPVGRRPRVRHGHPALRVAHRAAAGPPHLVVGLAHPGDHHDRRRRLLPVRDALGRHPPAPRARPGPRAAADTEGRRPDDRLDGRVVPAPVRCRAVAHHGEHRVTGHRARHGSGGLRQPRAAATAYGVAARGPRCARSGSRPDARRPRSRCVRAPRATAGSCAGARRRAVCPWPATRAAPWRCAAADRRRASCLGARRRVGLVHRLEGAPLGLLHDLQHEEERDDREEGVQAVGEAEARGGQRREASSRPRSWRSTARPRRPRARSRGSGSGTSRRAAPRPPGPTRSRRRTTKTFAATSATSADAPASVRLHARRGAGRRSRRPRRAARCRTGRRAATRQTDMPTEPTSSSGRRPNRSMQQDRDEVATMLMTP